MRSRKDRDRLFLSPREKRLLSHKLSPRERKRSSEKSNYKEPEEKPRKGQRLSRSNSKKLRLLKSKRSLRS